MERTNESRSLRSQPEVAAADLAVFRRSFYGCLTGWGDALFELCDSVLCSPTPVGSVPALSLEPVFRRSHGSLYKALAGGQIDTDRLRRLLVESRPSQWPAVFAVDASTWDRCDAETSPDRGFYYSASKHSNGQPIVAGWSYQWITQLDWAPDSWTAPVDARRITPRDDAVAVTIDQISGLVELLDNTTTTTNDDARPAPMFVFDAGYDPVALTVGLADTQAQILVRISPKRVFHPDPAPPATKALGRPRRHGKRFVLSDPATWTAPDQTLTTTDPRYGTIDVRMVRDASQVARAGPLGRPRSPTDRARHHHPRRSRTPPQTHRPHRQNPVAVVVRTRTTRPRHLLARLPPPIRHRAHLPIRQEHPRLDHTSRAHPRTSRPLDLAHHRRLHTVTSRPRTRRRPPPAMGTPPPTPPADPRTRPPRISSTAREHRHPSAPTEIPDPRTRTPQRHPKTTKNPPPNHQKDSLTRHPGFNRKLRVRKKGKIPRSCLTAAILLRRLPERSQLNWPKRFELV